MCDSSSYNKGHSCKQEESSGQPRRKIAPEHVQRAIWCLDCAVPLNHIVASCGHDPMNYQLFNRIMRQFRDAIRFKLRADKQKDIDVLFGYLEERLKEGHTAFACIEGISGSVDKMRLFLQSAEQILLLMEQQVTAISLDFVYKLIPNVGLCFGHFTTMSPSGRLVTVATFLVEGESGEALDWVFQRYDEALQKFGIECQSPVVFHDNASGHIKVLRKPGITKPILVSKTMMLDIDQSVCEFRFWRHPRFFEALCLAPTHIPKSWKYYIRKLGLTAQDSRALLGRVWVFALKMGLTDLAKLDEEWEHITQYALSLAKVHLEADDVLLPADLRLACQIVCGPVASGACSSSPAVSEDSQYLRYVDICNRLDTIAAQIESARSESRFESQSIQILQDELSRISKEICSNGLRDKDNLYNMMQIHREIQGKKAKKKMILLEVLKAAQLQALQLVVRQFLVPCKASMRSQDVGVSA